MDQQLDNIFRILSGSGPQTMNEIGLGAFVFLLTLSLASSLLIAQLYLFFYADRATGSQVHRAFPLLGISITAIFIAIQFSLPLSLGLLGALSIVRFRTPIKEPEGDRVHHAGHRRGAGLRHPEAGVSRHSPARRAGGAADPALRGPLLQGRARRRTDRRLAARGRGHGGRRGADRPAGVEARARAHREPVAQRRGDGHLVCVPCSVERRASGTAGRTCNGAPRGPPSMSS